MRTTVLTIIAMMACVLLTVPNVHAAGPGATDLAWKDNATNEAGYIVERANTACADAPAFAVIKADLPVNSQAYRDTTTAIGNKYCYRVRAWNLKFANDPNSTQYSAYSNPSGVDYPLAGPDGAPSGLTSE